MNTLLLSLALLLNRRLELVAAVRDYKDAAGERWIDPEREAELLQALVEANPGPLTERGVTSIFAAILDVLKQEVAADRRAPALRGDRERKRAVERLASSALVSWGPRSPSPPADPAPALVASTPRAACSSALHRAAGWIPFRHSPRRWRMQSSS